MIKKLKEMLIRLIDKISKKDYIIGCTYCKNNVSFIYVYERDYFEHNVRTIKTIPISVPDYSVFVTHLRKVCEQYDVEFKNVLWM